MFYFTEHIRTKVDSNIPCIAGSVDLSKAFDSLSHELLLKKLEKFGVNENGKNLLHSYLESRPQSVQMFGKLSKTLHTQRGVPQGTILGPLLFLCYLNDFANTIDKNVCLHIQYADDTTLIVSHKDPGTARQILKESLLKASKYFSDNQLMINMEKTQIIYFRKTAKTKGEPINLSEVHLKPSSDVKLLGVTFDETLSFEKEINLILKKMAIGIRTIQALKTFLPHKTRFILFHALVLSHLQYPLLLLTGITEKNKKQLNKQMKWGYKVCKLNGKNMGKSSYIQTFEDFINYQVF